MSRAQSENDYDYGVASTADHFFSLWNILHINDTNIYTISRVISLKIDNSQRNHAFWYQTYTILLLMLIQVNYEKRILSWVFIHLVFLPPRTSVDLTRNDPVLPMENTSVSHQTAIT